MPRITSRQALVAREVEQMKEIEITCNVIMGQTLPIAAVCQKGEARSSGSSRAVRSPCPN